MKKKRRQNRIEGRKYFEYILNTNYMKYNDLSGDSKDHLIYEMVRRIDELEDKIERIEPDFERKYYSDPSESMEDNI